MQLRLGDIAQVIMGQSPQSQYFNSNGHGKPFLQGNRTFGSKFPTYDTFTTAITKLGHKNSVVMSVRAPVGELNVLSEDTCLGRGVCALNLVDPSIDPDFLFYALKGNSERLKAKQSGTVFGSINKSDIESLILELPDKAEWNAIAKFLGDIDRKILVNEQINKNLLEQAISIFNWFYDSSTHQQPFSSVINVFGGGTPKTSDPNFWNGDIPFFTPKDVGNPYTFKTEKYITDDGLAKCNSRLYPTNTTFVTARGTVGKVSLAGVPMAMNQSCYALVSDTLDPILVYFYTLKVVSSLKHKASGAVFDAIVTRDFDNEMINILSDTDAQQLLEVVTPMFAAIHNNDAECLRLSALRDAILPKLLSGELAFEAN